MTADGRIWVIGGWGADPEFGDIWRFLRGEGGGPQRTVEVLETDPGGE
ncbi:MAG: hypothetical protein WEF50_11315 [Myxococcota bacterium]